MQAHSQSSALDAYIALAQELFAACQPMTYVGLGRALGASRDTVSAALRGHQHQKLKHLPVKHVVEGLDRELHGEGRLLYLWQVAKTEEAATEARLMLPRGGLLPILGRTVGPEKEVSRTDRRDLLRGMMVSGPVTAVLAMAQDTSRAMAEAYAVADPMTVHSLKQGAIAIGERYSSTPLAQLLPEVLDGWRTAENLLQGPRLRLGDRETLTRLAGQYAYFAARIGYHTESRELSHFGVLANQYASEVKDPILRGSIACLRIIDTGGRGEHSEAVEISAQTIDGAHAYFKPRILASRALNLAMLGRETEARDALVTMRGCRTVLPPAPGVIPWDEGQELVFAAMTLAELGDRNAVLPQVGTALSGIPSGSYEARANASLARAQAEIDRDPGVAAHGGLAALEINSQWPASSVKRRAGRLHAALASTHPDADGVAELGVALNPAAAV